MKRFKKVKIILIILLIIFTIIYIHRFEWMPPFSSIKLSRKYTGFNIPWTTTILKDLRNFEENIVGDNDWFINEYYQLDNDFAKKINYYSNLYKWKTLKKIDYEFYQLENEKIIKKEDNCKFIDYHDKNGKRILIIMDFTKNILYIHVSRF